MALPKGNYLAYQPLRPVNLTVGDFVEKRIDKYIKDGEAKKAAQLKKAAEERKSVADMYKDVKLDYTQTIMPLQQSWNKGTTDVINNISYAKRLFNDPNIPLEEARKQMMIAESKANNYLAISKLIGSQEFINGFNDRIKNIDKSAVYDPGLQVIDALGKGNAEIVADPETGMWKIGYTKSYQNKDGEIEWHDLNETIYSIMNITPNQSEKYKKLVEDQSKTTYSNEIINPTGNIKTEQNVFKEDKANTSFEINFGGFDVNSKNPLLAHLAFDVLGKPSVKTEEEYNKVKKRYVEDLRVNMPEKYSRVVEKSALEIANQEWDLKTKKKNFYKQDSTSNQETATPTLSNGNSIVQIRDDSGKVTGIQNWNINSISLPKLKGKPTSDNSFGVSSFRDSKGIQRDVWVIGAPAEDGKMVYSRINEKDLNEYVTKLGYNPIVVKQSLTNKQRALNRYTGQTQKGSIYDAVKINFKSKNIEDEDSNDATISELQNYIKNNK